MSRRKSRNEIPFVQLALSQPRGILFRFKIQQFCELHFHAGDIVVQNFLCEQLAFGGLAAGIANAAGCAAGDSDGMMAEQLKPPQRQQRHQIADVQTVCRRVEAAVKRDRSFRNRRSFYELLIQIFFAYQRRIAQTLWRTFRRHSNQATPLQFFVNVHVRRLSCRCIKANFQLWNPVHCHPRPHHQVFNRGRGQG